ncbi:MAG: sugar phosphate nucleotidyltransferase [Candidatus Thorarchaeota archaeon]|nr:sugar phosphate nucleotidyltransferase [Candidatus Thorarchaeota archaeon]
MAELRARINTEDTVTKVSQKEINEMKAQIVVVMPAGGTGTRIRAETHSQGIHKVMIPVAGKQSMIEKTVQDYVDCGIDKFVILTGFLAEKVEEHLGDGSRWGAEIRYSRDPDGRKVGNAGAILHALNNGAIDDSLTPIVHNPDDMIIGMDRPYGEVFLEGHLKGRKNGCIGTFVVVPESPFQFSGMVIDRGKVLDITKYPPIAVPAHTGITVFDPEVYGYFRRLVSLQVESSFENVICPVLAKEGRLFAINIPSETWIPVNTLKELERVTSALQTIG